jgi:ribosomal-protein-serine acetyltransferase
MLQIRSDGLLMRTLEDTDMPALIDAVRESVESVGRWMPWCTPAYAEVEARNWIELCRVNQAAGSAYDFGIFDESSSLFLGAAGFNPINKERRFCNLGYWVRQSRQRQRIAFRSVNMLAGYAFETLGLHRVEIVVAIGNAASEAVALKSGATAECVARNRLFIHGTPVPATVFSIVPQRFNEVVNTGRPDFIPHGR